MRRGREGAARVKRRTGAYLGGLGHGLVGKSAICDFRLDNPIKVRLIII